MSNQGAAIHYKTNALNEGRAVRGAVVMHEAAGSIRGALAELRARVDMPPGAVVGILASKAIADALRGVGEGPGADACAALAGELRDIGWTLEIGHSGRSWVDGTARFEIVDALVVLGPMHPDLASTRADAAFLGLDADTLIRGRSEAEMVQALGRARHLRRPGVALMVVAPEAPVGRDLPGVVWQTVEASTAPAGARWARVDAAELAEAHLARYGWIAAARLVAEGVGPRPAAAAVRHLARAHRLTRISGLPCKVNAYSARGDKAAKAAAIAWAPKRDTLAHAHAKPERLLRLAQRHGVRLPPRGDASAAWVAECVRILRDAGVPIPQPAPPESDPPGAIPLRDLGVDP